FLRETLVTQDQQYWVDWFADVDAAFAPVNDLRQGMDDPQVRARDMVVEDENGQEHLGIPIKFEREPGRINFHAPGLGEHNESIARELGLDDAEIQDLKDGGAFG
ncbi:MAG: CoA transferase, partial [Pseudomonadales bacterium]|nr:CoA transferase [Pseudomonadales bacterium]